MADAADLKSAGEILVGSSPSPGTREKIMPWLVIAVGYLIGSIPTAYIAGRLLKGEDIRKMGDGNVGARNAFHHLGHKTGVSIFIIDVSKGALAVVIALAVNVPLAAVLAAGAFTIIGHNWPVFIGFRGGRGESAAIGVLLVLMTLPMLIVCALTLTVLLIRKNVILSSAVMFISLPLISWWFGLSALLIVYGIGLPCLVAFTHFLRERQIALRRA